MPSEQNAPAVVKYPGPNIAPLYFIECSFGKRSRAFLECDRDRSSRRQVVDDIVSGEVENVLTVLEVFQDEGSCRDITSDIAEEVRDRIVNEQLPRGRHVNWLHEQLGCESIRWPVAAE